jgi:Tfp pilus assembly protein PilW
MRNQSTSQQGFMLAELAISISLILMLLACFINLFSTALKIWTFDNTRSHQQQTASIAVDAMVREIRFAKRITFNSNSSLMITKVNGEMNTFQLGGGLNSKTLYLIIDKTKAIPAGGISSNPITENVVTDLQFKPHPNTGKAVTIFLVVTDKNTGETQTIHTACYALNAP